MSIASRIRRLARSELVQRALWKLVYPSDELVLELADAFDDADSPNSTGKIGVAISTVFGSAVREP